MISFTITEKGYALKGADGSYFPFIQADIDNGPDKAGSAMAVVCALLYERYKAGKSVSYTHLDVYKRQVRKRKFFTRPFYYSVK